MPLAPLPPTEELDIPHFAEKSPGRAAAVELLWRAAALDSATAYLAAALPIVLQATGGDFAAVVFPEEGRWRVVAQSGPRQKLPFELFAEAADQESLAADQGWLVRLLARHSNEPELLAVHVAEKSLAAGPPSAALKSLIGGLAATLATALRAVRARHAQRRRIQRLEAILEIAQHWNQAQEMEPLLLNMAQAATRLLDADRASIFLWDRETKTLVGRPALGVKDNELRVPDTAGIVGQVLHSGQLKRVDAGATDDAIDRRVDRQLGYQTQNLLCVPLRTAAGEMLGVFEVLNKKEGDFSGDDETALGELAVHAAIALANTQEREDLLKVQRQRTDQAAERISLVGESPAIEALRSTVRRVADTELAILLLGENGTGKEVVSQSIHYLSRRRDQPFIAVNCGALAETLLESELFGHEKGAFTDAHEARQGKFELASGGTLFLDEIGDMSLAGQAKLLRVLEEKVVVRVGGSKTIRTDARVIAATNRNLVEMVRNKKFREDLYFRLNVVTLQLPPLRERGDDILLLAEYFLAEFCRRAHRKSLKFAHEAKKRLLAHAWPGNVRELRNLMERLAYLSQGDKIEAEDLAFILSPAGEQPAWTLFEGPLAEATDGFQIDYIQRAIKRMRGNMSDAAERLGLHRSNLYRKMRQLGMRVSDLDS
jgi:Nif-specific regulatory protein